MFIHGPGGTGKSTLLAKVLLDHLTAPQAEARFPYAYLDFDLSALNAQEPLTLLAEAARQLAVEYSLSSSEWAAARELWLGLIRRPEAIDANTRSAALGKFAELLMDSKTGAEEARRSEAFTSLSLSNVRQVLVSDLFERGLPFLLVLDTFEEVQYLDRYLVKDVVRFLNELRRQIPNLKVIVMGRAPLDELKSEFNMLEAVEIEGDSFGTGRTTDFNVIEVTLGEFSTADAIDYLTSQGLKDQSFAQELVDVVGGSPLSLRIVARMMKDEHIDIAELRKELEPATTNWFTGLFSKRKTTPKAVVQGVLFRRFLKHIHTDEIKDLAHPGLVLRRITPEIIREVLAGPCGLGELTEGKAEEYFWGLAREVSLVGTDYAVTGPVLIHRPDLRRVMLSLMQSDDLMLDKIRRIHEGAIAYYAKQPNAGQAARVEELYHRLMLGMPQDGDVPVDDIVTDEAILAGHAAKPSAAADSRPIWIALSKDVEELPPSGVAYLAARLQREIFPDAEWPLAHMADVELILLGRCTRQVRSRGATLTALLSLEQGMQRLSSAPSVLDAVSPLHIARLALNARLGRFDQAQSLVEAQLSMLAKSDRSDLNLRRQGETHLFAIAGASGMGKSGAIVEHLDLARSIAVELMVSSERGRLWGRRLSLKILRFAAKTSNIEISSEVTTFLTAFLAQSLESPFDIDLVQRPVLLVSIASRLAGSRLPEALLEYVTKAVPPGTDDVQAEARSFGELMPAEATFLEDDESTKRSDAHAL